MCVCARACVCFDLLLICMGIPETQQDTKEYRIMGVPKSEFSRSQKTGGIKGEVKRGKGVGDGDRASRERGKNEGKVWQERGPNAHLTKILILVPL